MGIDPSVRRLRNDEVLIHWQPKELPGIIPEKDEAA